MLNIPSAKDAYTSKLDDANEVRPEMCVWLVYSRFTSPSLLNIRLQVIKMATCISLQLQQLAASVQIKAVQQDMQGEKAAEQAP